MEAWSSALRGGARAEMPLRVPGMWLPVGYSFREMGRFRRSAERRIQTCHSHLFGKASSCFRGSLPSEQLVDCDRGLVLPSPALLAAQAAPRPEPPSAGAPSQAYRRGKCSNREGSISSEPSVLVVKMIICQACPSAPPVSPTEEQPAMG